MYIEHLECAKDFLAPGDTVVNKPSKSLCSDLVIFLSPPPPRIYEVVKSTLRKDGEL